MNGLHAAGLALATLVAYAFGSVPFGLLLVRARSGTDLRTTGSGNIGATNAMRSSGVGIGVTTLLLDALKGSLGCWLGFVILRATQPGPAWEAGLPVLAPIAGHCFPVWLGFRGGKGVATALGVLFVIDWKLGAAGIAVFALCVAATRWVSLGSIGGAIGAAVAAAAIPQTRPLAWAVAAGATLILVRHRANMRRILDGAEPRLGERGKGKA